MRRALRGQGGFTLVELMVAMSIFLLILVGVFQVFDPSSRAYSTSERKLGVQQNARVAMDVMSRQIRMAGYFPENVDVGTANDLSHRSHFRRLPMRPWSWPATSMRPAWTH